MDFRNLLPLVIVALVAFVVFRMALNAIKTSAKLLVWLVLAIVAAGAGFLWLQNQPGAESQNIPVLRIPANSIPSSLPR